MARVTSEKVNKADKLSTSGSQITNPKSSKISDELRQAVTDLGGDEEDLELIGGVDEDDEVPSLNSIKGKGKSTDEVRFSPAV